MGDVLPDAGVSAQVPSITGSAPAAAAPPDFSTMVPEAYRDKPYVERLLKSEDPLGNFFKSYDEAQSQIGKLSNRVEIPGDDATPDAVKAFNKARGVPDSPDGYQITMPDISKEPEFVQQLWKENVDENFTKGMKQKALELGLTPKQFSAMADQMHEYQLGSARSLAEAAMQASEQRAKVEEQVFAKHYGDQADTVIKRAEEIAAKIGIPKEFVEQGEKAALIYAMDYIHKKVFSNDTITPSSQMGAPGKTAIEIRAEIDRATANEAWTNKGHPRHSEHSAHVLDLYRQESELLKE